MWWTTKEETEKPVLSIHKVIEDTKKAIKANEQMTEYCNRIIERNNAVLKSQKNKLDEKTKK